MDKIKPVIFERFTTAANEKSAVDAGRQAAESHRALLETNVSRRRQRASSAEPGERIELLYLNALSIAESRNSVLKDDYDAKNFESLPQEEKLETLLRTIFLHAKLEKEELAFLGEPQSGIAPENMGEFLAKSYLNHIAIRSGRGHPPDDEVTFLKNIISIQEQRREKREVAVLHKHGRHADASRRNSAIIQNSRPEAHAPATTPREEPPTPVLPERTGRRPRQHAPAAGNVHQTPPPAQAAMRTEQNGKSWFWRMWDRVTQKHHPSTEKATDPALQAQKEPAPAPEPAGS